MVKQGICIDCEKSGKICINQPIIAGRCKFHYTFYRQKVCAERKKQKNVSKKTTEGKIVESNLVPWYTERMQECTGRCLNCGEPIWKIDRHSSIAHVLPKRKDHGFPSVATHPLNALELGPRCGCHNKYDHSWLSASKMKIFPEAIERAKILYPLLTREEKARFPEVFQSHVNS